MSKKSTRRPLQKPMITQTVIHPDAAGIDLASEVHYVAVPADRDPQPVRNFGTTTDELMPHPSHLSIAEAIAVAKDIGAPQTWLTHLTPLPDHGELAASLAPGITPAHDGLRLKL